MRRLQAVGEKQADTADGLSMLAPSRACTVAAANSESAAPYAMAGAVEWASRAVGVFIRRYPIECREDSNDARLETRAPPILGAVHTDAPPAQFGRAALSGGPRQQGVDRQSQAHKIARISMHRRKMIVTAVAAAAALALTGCSTNQGASASPAEKRAEVEKSVDRTMATLFSSVPGSRELVAKARAVLVFPSVYQAAFGVGGEYGEGALRMNGRTVGYYSTASGSFGFQAGAQSKALVYLFMTQDALDRFRNSNGWTAGADASVSLIKVGANGTIDTSSVSNAVNAFALTNSGLFGGVNLNGSKISKKDY